MKNLNPARTAAVLLAVMLGLAACSSTGSAIDSAISSASTAGIAAGITPATGSALALDDRHGTVEIARRFGKAIPCKEVVFTVDDDDDLYVTTICADKKGTWRWALAEPTVDRWGTLQ